MRILHILDHSLPLQSGYVFRTLGIVAQQQALGWEPVLLTSGKHTAPGPPRERIDGWEFWRTSPPRGAAAKFPWLREWRVVRDLGHRLDPVIEETAPDLLHAHSPVLNAMAALRAGRRHRLPVVYEVRALWEDAAASHAGSGSAGLRYRATRLAETRALLRADAVTTICVGLRDDLVGRGVPADKVTVIPNAVDRGHFAGPGIPDPALVARLGLAGRTVLAFFGSFYFYEGLHLLIEALPLLRRTRSDIALLLVGGGPEEERLQALARERGQEAHVVFAGRVAHDEVQRYYDVADLFVFPRISLRLTELVTPLKPLEAMAQQRIVAASSVGGHRELIRDRDTGYLFRPDDPRQVAEGVFAALADRDAWPAMRARAAAFIDAERSWAHSVARYEEVYRRALESSRSMG